MSPVTLPTVDLVKRTIDANLRASHADPYQSAAEAVAALYAPVIAALQRELNNAVSDYVTVWIERDRIRAELEALAARQ